MPSMTIPNTTWRPSNQEVVTVVMNYGNVSKSIQRVCHSTHELRAVGVLSSVGHREETGTGVAKLEVFVGELVTVDGLSASSVTPG